MISHDNDLSNKYIYLGTYEAISKLHMSQENDFNVLLSLLTFLYGNYIIPLFLKLNMHKILIICLFNAEINSFAVYEVLNLL